MPDSRPDVLHELELLLRSRYGLVFLRTGEEDRAASLLRHLADALGIPFFAWSRSQGLGRDGQPGSVYDTKEALKALRHVAASQMDGLYHFLGLGSASLTEELTVSVLRDATRSLEDRVGAIVITGSDVDPPQLVAGMAANLTLPEPDQEEFRELLVNLVRDLNQRGHVEVSITKEEEAALLRHLRGLTLLEAHKILTKAIIEDGRLGAADVRHVVLAKKELVEREGLLEYYPTDQSFEAVADLASLKAWLAKRQGVVSAPTRAASYGLDFPRGVLLLGVPGCGKSLSAKAVASEWGLPLLKLDPSNLYNKYIGESDGISSVRCALRNAWHRWCYGSTNWRRRLPRAAPRTEACRSGSSGASYPGCRTAVVTCSSWPPPTRCSASLPSSFARDASTRFFASTYPTLLPVMTYSASTSTDEGKTLRSSI